MNRRTHWNDTWTKRTPETVSWYQTVPEPSLRLVKLVAIASDAIIDIGGGASELSRALVDDGYSDLVVLDVSGAALKALATRLGTLAYRVRLIEADVLEHPFEPGSFTVWHDRAAYHFLTDPEDRARYLSQLESAVRAGGYAVLGTFAADGPSMCSGLPVRRYDALALLSELGESWQLVEALRHEHRTPSGVVQPFTFIVARRHGS